VAKRIIRDFSIYELLTLDGQVVVAGTDRDSRLVGDPR
jgi:hypothetical protein